MNYIGTLVAVFASLGYLGSMVCLAKNVQAKFIALLLMCLALGFHAAQVIHLVGGVYDTAVMGMLSLVAFCMAVIGVLLYFWRNDKVSYIVVAMIAALCVWLPEWVHGNSVIVTSAKLRLHIVLSMAAYIALGYAALYALFWISKDYAMRQMRPTRLLHLPLAYIERAMIISSVIGMFLLTLSLATGVLFIRDIWAQHLVHKTVFGLLSWVTIGGFLVLHFYKGFRGKKAAMVLLCGFVFLLLAYFGSAFVLQILLNR